jgi:hypothetical protein
MRHWYNTVIPNSTRCANEKGQEVCGDIIVSMIRKDQANAWACQCGGIAENPSEGITPADRAGATGCGSPPRAASEHDLSPVRLSSNKATWPVHR